MLELVISKERARIRVELKDLDLSYGLFPGHTVEYIVRLHGTTEARILDSGAEVVLTDSAAPAPIGSMLPMSLPEVMTPSDGVVKRPAFFVRFRLEDTEIDSIHARKAFVHFRGFIKYRDIFDRERETKFQYLWTVTDLATPGKPERPLSYWAKSGTATDNAET
jgi:hypothetical protein